MRPFKLSCPIPCAYFQGEENHLHFFVFPKEKKKNNKGETYIQILPHLLCDWVKNFWIKQKEFKCLTDLKLL